jgi:flagellar protein FlaG
MDSMNEMMSDGKVEKGGGDAQVEKSFSNPALLATKLFESASTKPNETMEKSSTKGLKSLAEEITQSLSGFKSLRLSMDRDMKQVIVRVVDKDTDNVIRQIPGERMMDLVKQMRDLEGILVKATA